MKYSVRKLCFMAILTAVSLSLFVVELYLPTIPLFPAAKIGIANTVTLFVLFLGGNWRANDAAFIMLARVILSAVVTGRMTAVMFSLVGGVLALGAMLAAKKIARGGALPLVSLAGAVGHNIGQMAVACFYYGTFSSLYYLPVFLLCGIGGGLLTGFAVYFVFKTQKRLTAMIKNI